MYVLIWGTCSSFAPLTNHTSQRDMNTEQEGETTLCGKTEPVHWEVPLTLPDTEPWPSENPDSCWQWTTIWCLLAGENTENKLQLCVPVSHYKGLWNSEILYFFGPEENVKAFINFSQFADNTLRSGTIKQSIKFFLIATGFIINYCCEK